MNEFVSKIKTIIDEIILLFGIKPIYPLGKELVAKITCRPLIFKYVTL